MTIKSHDYSGHDYPLRPIQLGVYKISSHCEVILSVRVITKPFFCPHVDPILHCIVISAPYTVFRKIPDFIWFYKKESLLVY